MENKTFLCLNGRNSLNLLLEFLRGKSFQTSPRTVRIYGGTGVSQKYGNPVRAVDSQTDQSINPQFRGQDIRVFDRNSVLRLKEIIEIRDESREQ